MFNVFLRCAVIALPTFAIVCPASAQSIADTPGVKAAQTVTTDFSAYSCTTASIGQTLRVGQVINNVYREWVESYAPTSQGRALHCVTTLRPDAAQLTRGEAEALLNDSRSLGASSPKTAAAPRSGVERSQADTKSPTSMLPRPSYGLEKGVAVPSAAPGMGLQALQPATSGDANAVLDLGFPKPAVEAKKPATSAAPERAASIGADDRVRVFESDTSPWTLIGQLVVTWKDGTQSACTGTLVSGYVVLTAGQCAHNRDKGGFAARATFAPGQLQGQSLGATVQPYGARTADFVETNGRWTQVSGGQTLQTLDSRSDYAAYYFIQPWTHTTTFMPMVYGEGQEAIINTAGYPTDAGGGKNFNQGVWFASGTETSRSKTTLRAFQVREFTTDVSAGDNGAPFWTFDGNVRRMTGIVSYGGDEVAGGAWFGGDNQAAITAFVTWTPGTSAPTHNADDLRVPVAYPSPVTFAGSYLRFYNPTPQAGSVTVSVSDGDTGVLLGRWTSPSIAPFAAMQFEMKDIEKAAAPIINPANKDRYTLNIASNFLGYFQHVLWNPAGASLTNLSGCSNGISNDVIHLSGVHSTIIKGYPSVILVHNVGTKTANAIVGVYNARSGIRIGGIVIPNVPADADAVFGVNDVEAVLGFTPTATDFHYNLVLESDFPGYLQHLVYNTGAGLITNMTAKCAMPVH
jgi:V8-like Glu-specific endopeptidase